MADDIKANAEKLAEVGERLGQDGDLRNRLAGDPLEVMRSLDVEVPAEFQAPVAEGLKTLASGETVAPDAAHQALAAEIDARAQAPSAPTGLKVSGAKTAAADDFEFRVNGWGLVLVVPESKIELIRDGGLTATELGQALMAALSAGAGAFVSVPPLAAILAAGSLFCAATAMWMLAETLVILAVDAKHHKGVYLTWTWVGLALTAYLPIPTPVTKLPA